MGRKVYTLYNSNEEKVIQGYSFYCPGCKYRHVFYTKQQHTGAPVWSFNGDLEKPTFRASLLQNANNHTESNPRCHIFVTDGKIQYLNDCTHHLAGKTIEMEDIE